MRKFLLLAATAALTLASCTEEVILTQDDVLSQVENGSGAIEFGTYMSKQGTTRAGKTGSMTNTSIKASDAGFGVFAYYTAEKSISDSEWGWDATTNSIKKAPNFMYNQKVAWEVEAPSGNWGYSPVKYWPNGNDLANQHQTPSSSASQKEPLYLSFFAYAPYAGHTTTAFTGGKPSGVTNAVVASTTTNGIVAMSKNNETTDMQVKYSFGSGSANEKSAVDLLWGLRGQKVYYETDGANNTVDPIGTAYNTDLTKQIVPEKVKFLFKHALSRVGGSTSSSTSPSGNQICGFKVVVDVDKNSDTPKVGQSSQTTYFSTDFNNDKTLVTIKEVKIRDQYTYSNEPGSTITANTRSDFLTEGWFNIMKGTWTSSESNSTTSPNGVTYSVVAKQTPGTGEYNLNPKIKEGTPSNSGGADWTTSNSGGAEGVELTAKNVFADEDVPGLLLIPGTGGNTIYITVDYLVRTADPNLSTGYTEVEQVITNKVTLDGSTLNPNKYYTLVMHLGLTSVKFEAVVADWATGDNTDYEETGEQTTPGDGEHTSIWLPSNVIGTITTAASAVMGNNRDVELAASTTTYPITFSGFDTSLTIAGSGTKVFSDAACTTEIAAGVASAAVSGSVVTVTYDAVNKTKKQVYYVKVTDAASKTSIIKLTRMAGEITLTPTYAPALVGDKMPKEANTITLNVKDATSADIDLTDAGNSSTITVTPETGVTVTKTSTGATISIPANAGSERTFNISVKVNDAPIKALSITQTAGA